ncbi:hypothetical protein QJQ45_004180 [Haematococcus lacustris]|nr:hypothetical protein QJQ45_004180 [Haematococcus lacustris]
MDENEDFERKRAARIARNRSVLEQLKVSLYRSSATPCDSLELIRDHSESGSDGEPFPATRSSKQQAVGQRGKGTKRGGTSAPPGDDDEYDPSIESDGAEEEEEEEEEEAADKAVEDLPGSNASRDAQGTVQQLAVHPPQKRRRSGRSGAQGPSPSGGSSRKPRQREPVASASMTTAAASAQRAIRVKAAEAGWLGGDSEEDDVQLQLALALSLQQPDNAPCSAPCQASQQEVGAAPVPAASVPANGSAQDDTQGACTVGQDGSQVQVKAAEACRGSSSAATGKAGEKRRKGGAGMQTSRTGWDGRFTEGEVLQVFQALQPNKQGLLTRSALATAMDKLGLDSNDMRLQSMLELADWRQHPYLAAYELQHVIGEGGFSEVWLALHKLTKQKVVIKAVYLSKPGLRPEQAVILEAEAKFLRLLDHPHIVRCHSVLESKYDLLLVPHKTGLFLYPLEVSCQQCLSELPQAVLQNSVADSQVMFKRPVAAYHAAGKAPKPLCCAVKVKLIDLGMAGVLGTKASGMLHGCMGSPGFMAPEVVRGGGWAGMVVCAYNEAESYALAGTSNALQKSYQSGTCDSSPAGRHSEAMDVYGLGVLLFVMLTGRKPFNLRDVQSLQYAHCSIREAPGLQDPVFLRTSLAAQDLIVRMLADAPEQRPTAKQVLAHPWISGANGPAPQRPVIDALVRRRMAQLASLRQHRGLAFALCHNAEAARLLGTAALGLPVSKAQQRTAGATCRGALTEPRAADLQVQVEAVAGVETCSNGLSRAQCQPAEVDGSCQVSQDKQHHHQQVVRSGQLAPEVESLLQGIKLQRKLVHQEMRSRNASRCWMLLPLPTAVLSALGLVLGPRQGRTQGGKQHSRGTLDTSWTQQGQQQQQALKLPVLREGGDGDEGGEEQLPLLASACSAQPAPASDGPPDQQQSLLPAQLRDHQLSASTWFGRGSEPAQTWNRASYTLLTMGREQLAVQATTAANRSWSAPEPGTLPDMLANAVGAPGLRMAAAQDLNPGSSPYLLAYRCASLSPLALAFLLEQDAMVQMLGLDQDQLLQPGSLARPASSGQRPNQACSAA